MNRTARIALIFGGVVLGMAAPAFAQTATANLGISATVNATCTITTTPVAFGTYDPVVTHASSPLDATGSVVVTCTKGAGTRIDLGTGGNFSAGARRMAGGSDFLTYELYQDSGRTTVWGSGAGAGNTIGAAPSKAPRTVTVYGRVPGGQDVSANSYADTVVATINF
ncbi:MAG TPA: spore coat U domain-containing protein [Methylomirabilota bacterium]|nr:spore coat U domain-containing protein [Methylomirabilota bacterium]